MKTRQFGLVAVLTLALLLSAAPPALAAPGDLDPSFDGDGIVTTDFDSTFDRDDGARAVVVDSAGRIVVVGETNNTATRPDFALARYLVDGSLDASFGIGGKVITDFGTQEYYDKDLALDSVGRIIVVGTTTNYWTGTNFDFVVGRYLPDGSLDPSFGVGGKVIMDIGGLSRQDWANAVTVDSMGRILVAGCHDCQTGYPHKFVLARYLDNGTLDPSFGTGGLVIADFGYAIVPGEARAVMLDAAGRIVVGGGRILARFLPDGTLDTSFGTNGWSYMDFPPGWREEIWAVTLDATDRILVAGEIENEYYVTRVDFALARYSKDGAVDSTFGVDGWVATDFLGGPYAHDDYARAVVVDPAGRIVVSGHTYPAMGSDFAVARYLDSGMLDPEFGSGGKVVTDFGSGSGNYDFASDVALDALGRIVVVGQTDTQNLFTMIDFAVARYLGDEPLPPPTTIDIKPGESDNVIPYKSRGKTQVAILSSETFDAPSQVAPLSLTFGRTGDEKSLSIHKKGTAQCDVWDADADGLADLVCAFLTEYTGFQPGDSEGVLKGETVAGVPFEARDSVRVVPK